MRDKRLSAGFKAAFVVLTATLLVTNAWAAPHEKVLHNFNRTKGASPTGLIFDAAGNLYGTTYSAGGGSCNVEGEAGCGNVFELTPKSGGVWTEKVLYSFKNNGKDGNYPSAGLIFDGAGNLYGTTIYGGSGKCESGDGGIIGCGTVFELTPKAGGGWTEKVLHSFRPNGGDGWWPVANVISDAAGNLYGTTFGGGDVPECSGDGCGTVFELTPKNRRGLDGEGAASLQWQGRVVAGGWPDLRRPRESLWHDGIWR
jgi:uncharacterized repeat protein (TIGR03803 family)